MLYYIKKKIQQLKLVIKEIWYTTYTYSNNLIVNFKINNLKGKFNLTNFMQYSFKIQIIILIAFSTISILLTTIIFCIILPDKWYNILATRTIITYICLLISIICLWLYRHNNKFKEILDNLTKNYTEIKKIEQHLADYAREKNNTADLNFNKWVNNCLILTLIIIIIPQYQLQILPVLLIFIIITIYYFIKVIYLIKIVNTPFSTIELCLLYGKRGIKLCFAGIGLSEALHTVFNPPDKPSWLVKAGRQTITGIDSDSHKLYYDSIEFKQKFPNEYKTLTKIKGIPEPLWKQNNLFLQELKENILNPKSK